MKSKITSKQYASIVCGDEVLKLTFLPLTFKRLIEINFALKDKDLGAALSNPTPMEIAKIGYCLLDAESIAILNLFKIEIENTQEETNTVHKFYCIICENNVTDGLLNYTSILQAVTTVIQDSFSSEDKKKATRLLRHSIWKRFSTLLRRAIPTLTKPL